MISEWKTIDSAPLNPAGVASGPMVLLFCGYDRVIRQAYWVAKLDGKSGWYEHSGNGLKDAEPTHWIPLPAPPKAK